MELKVTTYEVTDDGVAVVTLARPDRGNSWTHRMHDEYRWLMAEAEADAAVRVIVVTGEGRQFCVGADFQALEQAASGPKGPDEADEPRQPGYGLRDEFDHDLVWHWGLRKPVIAAINGACAGIALALASFCDLRFAAEGAKLTAATTRLGLPAEYGLDWILPRLVGLTHASDILLTGRIFESDEARQMGFLNGVFPRDGFLDAVMERARALATGSAPEAMLAVKRQMFDALLGFHVGESIDRSKALIAELATRPDFIEGVKAVREKRQPAFQPLKPETPEPSL